MKSIITSLVLLLSFTGPVAAQVKPIPAPPLTTTPDRAARSAPLQIELAPAARSFVPFKTGSSALVVRTRGGARRVTLTMTVDGPRAQLFTLANPAPSTNPNVVAPAAVLEDAARQDRLRAGMTENPTAPSVTKVVAVAASQSTTRPADHRVTVTARDEDGVEKRVEFTVLFTTALGAPVKDAVAGFQSAATRFEIDPDQPLAARTDDIMGWRVITRPHMTVDFKSSGGEGLGWDGTDPDSYAICIYAGGFRYRCDADGARSVNIEDIGRGTAVSVILRNPYGESNPVQVKVNTQTEFAYRSTFRGDFTPGGTITKYVSPANGGMALLRHASTRACGEVYLVWDAGSVGGRVYSVDPKGPPLNMKLIGDARLVVAEERAGTLMTNDAERTWLKLAFTVPTAILAGYTYDLTMKYSTRVGECANRRL